MKKAKKIQTFLKKTAPPQTKKKQFKNQQQHKKTTMNPVLLYMPY